MTKLIYIFLLFAFTAFAQEAPNVPDVQEKELSTFFDGAWMPDLDPAEIGYKNYKELKNLRYASGNKGLEGVRGYTKINTTPIATWIKIRSGFQLATDRTTQSHVLIQAESDTETSSWILANTTAIPDQGDFDTSIELDSAGHYYRTDSSGAGLGRFSSAPLNSLTYANGVETLVWSSEEMSVAKFYTLENTDPADSGAYPINGTEAVKNDSSADTISIGSGTRDFFLVMTSRPIQGVYFDLSVVNGTASVLSATYWKNDATWAAVSNAYDATDIGPALGQDGWYMFDATTDAAPYHYQGDYYYAYKFALDAGSATFQYVTVNSYMQDMVDLWDGVPRQPKQFQIWRNGDSKFKDWTLEVNEYSYEALPYVAQMDAMSTSDYLIVMSDDRLSGIRFEFMAGWVNTAASVANVSYWNGSAYTAVTGTEIDGTSLSGATMGQNGLLWWQPPASTSEAPKTQFGVTGYSYKITFTVALSGTYSDESDIMTEAGDVALDVVTLVPAQKDVLPVKFTSQYKNRVLACGYLLGKQGNRCDYTQKNSTEIWNGEDSSDGGIQSLYFETSQDLTAGKEIYNRYGSQVITVWAAFTDGETHVLKGSSPEDFAIIKVSENIGCPAPLTLVSAEVGYEVAEGLKRNILIWLSSSGPYGFDGQVLFPIHGVDKYFDPDDDDAVNFDEIDRSRGWYDQAKKEYNLLIPSGASQATNNVWLVYNLVKKKWFRKDTGDAEFPQVGFQVQDTQGTKYVYGAIDTGYMMRLENGASWDGDPIEQIVETGDFWPTGNIWDLTRIRQIKVMAKRINEENSLTINHSADTDDSLGLTGLWMDEGGLFQDWEGGEWVSATLASMDLYLNNSINRIVRDTIQDNLFGWSHRFEFVFSTDDTTKGFQPLGWGIVYYKEDRRDD